MSSLNLKINQDFEKQIILLMIPNKIGIILQQEVVCVIKTNNIKVNFIVEIKLNLKAMKKYAKIMFFVEL